MITMLSMASKVVFKANNSKAGCCLLKYAQITKAKGILNNETYRLPILSQDWRHNKPAKKERNLNEKRFP